MEIRRAKMIFNKSAGSSGKGATTKRVTIPSNWANAMDLTIEDRELELIFDENEKEIIIRKA